MTRATASLSCMSLRSTPPLHGERRSSTVRDEPIGRERKARRRAVQERGRQAAPSRVRAPARAGQRTRGHLNIAQIMRPPLAADTPGRRRPPLHSRGSPPPAPRVRIIPRYVFVPAQAPSGGWGVFSAGPGPSRGEWRRGLLSACGSRPGCRSPWCPGRCDRGWPG
jgi:hypothetical protein